MFREVIEEIIILVFKFIFIYIEYLFYYYIFFNNLYCINDNKSKIILEDNKLKLDVFSFFI